MKKIIVYASGSLYDGNSEILKVSRVINREKAEVIAYFDEADQVGMQEILFEKAKMLRDIEEIKTMTYDYIVIASYEYNRITKLLLKEGIAEEKIVQFFNYHFYLLDEFFFNEKRVQNNELQSLFSGTAAARMALKY